MFDTSENSLLCFCVATWCCNDWFNEMFFIYGVSILVVDPMDSAILGMINVKKLHGKSITFFLWSHQIQDALGHNAYSSRHTLSFFKTGRHSQLWSSILYLMHLWAQLHRKSLFGICASKIGSCWMNLSSCCTQTRVQLRLHLRNYCVWYVGADAFCTWHYWPFCM